MKAALLQKERFKLGDDRFAEIVVWRVLRTVPGSAHSFKYRLVLVENEVSILRYDNEAGKGDHKHLGGVEVPYAFSTLDQLVDDFWTDVATL